MSRWPIKGSWEKPGSKSRSCPDAGRAKASSSRTKERKSIFVWFVRFRPLFCRLINMAWADRNACTGSREIERARRVHSSLEARGRSVVRDSRYHPSTLSCLFRSEMRRAGGGCTERSQAVSQLATTTPSGRKKVRETVSRALIYAVLTRSQDGRQPPSSPLARSVRRARWLGRRTLWMRKTSRR